MILLGHGTESILTFVYSSETGAWGDVISMMLPQSSLIVSEDCPNNTLVRNSICWLLVGKRVAILEFDLGQQSLALLEAPQDPRLNFLAGGECKLLLTQAEGGVLGFLALSGFNIWSWQRKTDSDGVAGWVLKNTIALDSDSVLPLRPCVTRSPPEILWLDEDNNVMFLLIDGDGIFMINLESTQFKQLPLDRSTYCMYLDGSYPFTSFYPSGK